MASSLLNISFLILLSYLSPILCRSVVDSAFFNNAKLQTYIVHVQCNDAVAINSGDLEDYYRSFLPPATTDSQDSDRLVFAYHEVFSGFAARLTEDELKEMSKKQGFVRAYPNIIYPLLTTHTPDFLGLPGSRGVWNRTNLGRGVVVGVLDTGILPGHPSFNDEGVPSPPASWKGKCDFTTGCNNKVIAAKDFTGGGSPVDEEGHGSHTASTIAGNFVKDINAFGLGEWTMAGMAPHAHLAIYKVCSQTGCPSDAILAALDAGVRDGVDVLSLSLGGISRPYDQDPIAIGAFRANEKGVTVVCAGGNDGPYEGTVLNEAPWILTVAASTIDRSFRATVKLGDGTIINGEFLYQPANFSSKPVSLLYPSRGICASDLSNGGKAKGKIVVCSGGPLDVEDAISTLREAGGVGLINILPPEDGYTILLSSQLAGLAGSMVTFFDGQKINKYTNTTSNPTASLIFNHTVLGVSPAPVVAFFSSRGPSYQSPGILKPDIAAPGLNILAAWNVPVDPSSEIPYNIISGTSMATPHVSGITALIKSLHPDWSPSAIRSAIITSSDVLDREGKHIEDEQHKDASFFMSGAGHINPSKAAEPGLVYETEVENYIAYLCSALGESGVSVITGRSNSTCAKLKNITDSELNYPTITVSLSSKTLTVNRTVTNVGAADAMYTVEVDVPKGVTVTVLPNTLKFSKVNKKQSFSVTVKSSRAAEGNLKWVSGKTVVRSALVITA